MAMRNEDFDEEEMWGYANERELDSSPTPRKPKDHSSSSSSVSAWRLPTAPSIIRKHETMTAKHSSAPVDIPDWSKIYGKQHANNESKSRNGSWVDNVDDGNVHNHHHDGDYGDEEEEEEDDDDDMMIPPHEWLAKKFARSQISSFSVCEGMGRTLKGRDLSKVRNAVLTKTGFIE